MELGTYDTDTNTYYVAREGASNFGSFTYNAATNEATYVDLFTLPTGDSKSDDWALHTDGIIYGVDGGTLEIWDVGAGTYTEVPMSQNVLTDGTGVFSTGGTLYAFTTNGDYFFH